MKKPMPNSKMPIAAPPVAAVAPPVAARPVAAPPPVAAVMPPRPMGMDMGAPNKLPANTRHKHGSRGMK